MALAPYAQFPLLAQETAATTQRSAISVPFIGCRSDGQLGPVEAPKSTGVPEPISRRAAQKLAYYRSAQGMGVIAPRSWYCFGTYGSGGDALLLSSEPIETAKIFSTDNNGLRGPAIEISRTFGDTSGRFGVAEVIARVFPAYKAFVARVMDEFNQPASQYAFGPFPKDTLNYKSQREVEYTTPAQTDGLGTRSWLRKNGSPIDGVAILVGQTPDLLLLAVRLPTSLTVFTPEIVTQVEREAMRHPGPRRR